MPEAENKTKLAYVALPADLMSDSLYRIIREELGNKGYHVLRRDDATSADQPERVLALIAYSDLVVVDTTRIDRETDLTLGAAIAFSASSANNAQRRGPRVIALGDQQGVPSEVASRVPFEKYDRGRPETAADAISRLLGRYSTITPIPPPNATDMQAQELPVSLSISDIPAMVPTEVLQEVPHPLVALLLTIYIEHIGSIVGEELAATTGFPTFPGTHEERLELINGITRRRGSPDSGAVLDLLERSLRSYQHAEPGVPQQTAEEASSLRMETLADAILSPQRTPAQTDELSRTLSRIASTTAIPRTDIRSWPAGIKAISRITRLIVSATPPSAVNTNDRIVNSNTRLHTIATLGGAHFLGGTVGILSQDEAGQAASTYGREGLRIANLTSESQGQRVEPLAGDKLERYKSGLRDLAARDDFIFAIEHPFHFRVLLEVLSDENRRYPAESVLNFHALRSLWGPDNVWDHFTWSRDQHPIVGNLVERESPQTDLAFLQHYVSFGRTPHTSSFVRLDYNPVARLTEAADEDAENMESLTYWWPEAVAHLGAEPIRNLPSSVCAAMYAIDRQRMLGRIWRGDANDSDILWIGGELLKWNGLSFTDGALAGAVWDSTRWDDPGFPRMALAEIRIGTWLIQALRRRLESYAPAPHSTPGEKRLGPAAIPVNQEQKVAEELSCVLAIMCFFVEDYTSGPDDGVTGLRQSLNRMREDHRLLEEMGRLVGQRLGEFERLVDDEGSKLESELRLVQQLLRTWRPAAQ
jgi:hypothetical protein